MKIAGRVFRIVKSKVAGHAKYLFPWFLNRAVIKLPMICYVDINDACQLECPTCARGAGMMANTAKVMPLEMFEKIVAKARGEGYYAIGTYSWSEPFLNKDFPRYVEVIKRAGLVAEVSSNLSLRRVQLILDSLSAGIDRLYVSISGFTQNVYAINHRNGNSAIVKENLEAISAFLERTGLPALVTVKFLKFTHNVHEEPLVREYAESLGLSYECLEAVGDPSSPVNDSEEVFLSRMSSASGSSTSGSVCPLVADTLSVDAGGRVSICCAYPNYDSLVIGDYLALSRREILLRRHNHKLCRSCSFPRRELTSREPLFALLSGAADVGAD